MVTPLFVCLTLCVVTLNAEPRQENYYNNQNLLKKTEAIENENFQEIAYMSSLLDESANGLTIN